MRDNWLRDYGYSAVHLPRRDLSPTDVMIRDSGKGDFTTKVGALTELFASEAPLPQPQEREPTGNLSRTVEKKVELSLGLKILGGLIGSSNASKLGTDSKMHRARTLTVSYEDVMQDSVSILGLQGWLEQARVETNSQAMRWLNDDKLAAITASLRSAKLSIAAETDSGASLELDVPEIQGLISGDFAVEASSKTSAKVTFQGDTPVTFGVQLFKMIYEGNVSFGLEQVKGLEEPDFAHQAFLNDDGIDEPRDATALVSG